MIARIRPLIWPALITLAVLLAPLAPLPLNFWLALSAALLGPGLGVPRLLFPKRLLSLPETLLMTCIASMFLESAILAIVNVSGVLLSPIAIGAVILAPTYLLAIAAALRERFYAYPDAQVSTQADQPAWLPFCCGVALAAVVAGGVLRLLGV